MTTARDRIEQIRMAHNRTCDYCLSGNGPCSTAKLGAFTEAILDGSFALSQVLALHYTRPEWDGECNCRQQVGVLDDQWDDHRAVIIEKYILALAEQHLGRNDND